MNASSGMLVKIQYMRYTYSRWEYTWLFCSAIVFFGTFYQPGGGENVPGITGAYATLNFTYLARSPCRWQTWIKSWKFLIRLERVSCQYNILEYAIRKTSAFLFGLERVDQFCYITEIIWRASRWNPRNYAFHISNAPSEKLSFHNGIQIVQE